MAQADCNCHSCREERATASGDPAWHWKNALFVTCPNCGNKRCPKATNHRHACTNSNEPGQKGSVYGDYECE